MRATRDDNADSHDSGQAVINQLRGDDKSQESDDYLDIPTFLRNQLD